MKTQLSNNRMARSYGLILGIIGFIFMQCGLIITEECITEILTQINTEENHLDL